MSSPAEAYAAFRQRQKLAPIDQFAHQLGFELDPFQIKACQALLEGRGVLVAAPTGAGKTAVARFGIEQTIGHGHRACYTTPIKALSNQKYRELVTSLGEGQVGLLTGDQSIRPDAPVVVMTTEVLRNQLYAQPATLASLGLVVVDEVHYLADRFRGPVWEEVLIQLPAAVTVVALSATVSNAEEFGQWLELVRGQIEVVVSDKRPVPLWQQVLTPVGLMDLYAPSRLTQAPRLNPELVAWRPTVDRRRHRQPNRGGARHGARQPRPVVAQVLDKADLVPAIFFVFSRAGCDAAVQACLRGDLRLNSQSEAKAVRPIFEAAAHSLDPGDLAVVGYPQMVQAAERGFGAHHAGQLPVFKEAVELAFQEGLIKVVFATETLSLGINMPARTVVLDRLDKWDGASHQMLTAGEYTQLTGRAGRRGIDVEGHTVVVAHPGFDPHQLLSLASKRSYRLDSAFKPTYNMAVNLIRSMGAPRARQVLELSFAQFQADRSVVDLAREVRQLDQAIAGYKQASEGEAPERWVKRLRRAESRRTGLMGAINARTTSVVRQFAQVQRVLTELGYLENQAGQVAVTKAGNVLGRIYAERDLVIAEAVRSGSFDQLPAAELAAVVAALVYEPRAEWTGDVVVLPRRARRALGSAEQAWRRVDSAERAAGLPPTPGLESAASEAVFLWATGAPLGTVLPACELTPGDFVRLVKQVIDVLGHLVKASPDASLGAAAKQAAEQLRRGVVAWDVL